MLRIRLRRMGAKKQASYRVVVADQRSPRDGRFVEIIGYYNPRTDPITFRIDEERALYWLTQGAQSSEAVERLLRKGGTRERLTRLQAGEPLETLLAEAKEQLEEEVETKVQGRGVTEVAEAAEEAPLEDEEEVGTGEEPEEPELVDET